MNIEELKEIIKERKKDTRFYFRESEEKTINRILSDEKNEEAFNVGYYSALQDIEDLLK